MPSRATLGIALLAGVVAVERPRGTALRGAPLSQRALPARPLLDEPSAGAEGLEDLSQSELERRLDQLEQELSAGGTRFPSSGRPSSEPGSANFGVD